MNTNSLLNNALFNISTNDDATGGAASGHRQSGAPSPKQPILVKQLGERDRSRMRKHFIALQDSDRLLRFGMVLSDELIEAYVAKIDFSRDIVYGVYGRALALLGVGHLAFAPCDALPALGCIIAGTGKERVAEFGVSVAASARGMGIGSQMFERAAMHCRNADIDTLTMHCLSSNHTMMHIAKKAGMEIHRDGSEADAYLRLLPSNPASIFQEAIEEQAANFDYTFRANTHAVQRWLGSWSALHRE
jgi:GNAT superfamily N-acetyltransferase